ncbi:Tight junction protein ZO-1 [Lamellibrachia satsuma]|nr:Tight junction protein ZO-1 [Lamellibrachia satsuma]
MFAVTVSSDLQPSSFNFEAYKKLVTPGFYGAKKSILEEVDPQERETTGGSSGLMVYNRDHRNSAFESYKKPTSPSDIKQPSTEGEEKNDSAHARQMSDLDIPEEDGHRVVATARGVFDSSGGVLESKETGVSIIIPKGAIPDGVQQEIYFKVCQDNSILPPLDKEKGETLLSPLVMCGPHGLKFLQPVELRLPHCASVNPDSWSFALKSSSSPTGHPTQWQNMTLAGIDGLAQGRVGKNSVSVLVDHF